MKNKYYIAIFSILFLSLGCDSCGVNPFKVIPDIVKYYLAEPTVSPVDGATGIDVGTSIQVRFNKEIDQSTITNTTFILQDDKGVMVNGPSPELTEVDNSVVFIPSSPLNHLTKYTAILSKKIKSRSGLSLARNYSWSFTTVVGNQIGSPQFHPAPGSFDTAQSVTITSPEGSTIRYTTNGDDPTPASGTIYSNTPITIEKNTVLKAIAYRTAYIDSVTTSGDYKIRAPRPYFTPYEGEINQYNHDVDVSITVNGGATIHYTINGDIPNASSPVYTGPIPVHGNKTSRTIRAISILDGYDLSQSVAATYTINYDKVGIPQFSLEEGTHTPPQTVTISTATTGATIRYTTNGDDPTPSSGTIYDNTPITIEYNTVLKAIAYRDQMENSDIAAAEYKFSTAVPVFTPGCGSSSCTYGNDIDVSVTAEAGADIYYSTTGPEGPFVQYTGPIPVTGHCTEITIYAFAQVNGREPSGVTSAAYSIQYNRLDTPAFSPEGGRYKSAQTVTITSTAGSTIRYSTDGSDPTTSPLEIQSGEPIEVNDTLTIRAYAYMDQWLDSELARADYIIEPKITGITPNRAGNTRAVNVTITGTNFKAGASVYLTRDGYSGIAASEVTVAGNTQITCKLDITNAAGGLWNVEVNNSDGGMDILAEGFTICAIPRNGLVGEWLLTGTFFDSSGNNFHGSCPNDPVGVPSFTYDRVGNASCALEFDGIEDYVLIRTPLAETILEIQDEVTISAWINISHYPVSDMQAIAGSQNDECRSGITMYLDASGMIHLRIGNDTVNPWYTTRTASSSVPTNRWVHIAASWKYVESIGGTSYIYYDAVSQDITSDVWQGSVKYDSFSEFDIGRQRNIESGSRYFEGMIDNVRVYNRELTTDEIESLFIE